MTRTAGSAVATSIARPVAGELIHDGQPLERGAVAASVVHEIIGPEVPRMRGLRLPTGTFASRQSRCTRVRLTLQPSRRISAQTRREP
jgi:hypothetical protein